MNSLNNLSEYADPRLYDAENSIIEQYGDFDKSMLSNDSKQIIYICRKRS